MARYSAHVRHSVFRKLLPPEKRSAKEPASEYGASVGTIYSWKARMNNSTLQVGEGARSNRHRGLSDEELGGWLRDQEKELRREDKAPAGGPEGPS